MPQTCAFKTKAHKLLYPHEHRERYFKSVEQTVHYNIVFVSTADCRKLGVGKLRI